MPPIITNVDQKALKSTKFPPEFNKKIDTGKINVAVIKNWAAGEVSRLLGFEDDVVSGLLFDLLDSGKNPDIKSLQLQLGGFLGADAPTFCKELWNLCLSAQDSPTGVPQQLLEAKKAELRQERQEQEHAAEQARLRREQQESRDRDLDDLRYRDRRDRDDRRGFRGGRGFDRGPRPRRDFSRSPPRRRFSPDRGYDRPLPTRDVDSYVPGPSGRHDRPRSPARGDRRRPPSRRRSPSSDRDSSPELQKTRPGNNGGRRNSSPRRHRSRSPRRYRGRYSDSPSRSPPRRRPSPRSNRHRHSPSRSPPRRRYDGNDRDRRPGRRSPSLSPERLTRPANKFKGRLSRSPSPAARGAAHRRHRSPSPARQTKRSRRRSRSESSDRRSTTPRKPGRGSTPPSARSDKKCDTYIPRYQREQARRVSANELRERDLKQRLVESFKHKRTS